jgi:hypothetical protein
MKSIILSVFLILTPAGMAIADNDVGCGVGTQIMEGQSGLPAKLAASFTNGLLFQSVSITFGLLNCDGRGTVTASNDDARLRHYASVNFDQLAVSMAEGRGESLDVFSTLMGVQEPDRARFEAFTQRHFAELFSHDEVTVGEMLDTLNRLLAEDATLSAYARS